VVLAAGGGFGGKKPERKKKLLGLNPLGQGQHPPRLSAANNVECVFIINLTNNEL